MTELMLTPAEIEMINVKREQEELALRQLEAQKALKLEEDIKRVEAKIAKSLLEDKAQIAAAKTFADELGPLYQLIIKTRSETLTVTGDYTAPDDPSSNGYQREVLWSKTIDRNLAVIKRTDYTISVVEHVVYKRWSNSNKGWKMRISGPGIDWKQEQRYYARTGKINSIIIDTLNSIDFAKQAELRKRSALEQTISKMKELYPTAVVKSGSESERSYYNGRRWSAPTVFDCVTIQLDNGITVKYRVYPDASLSRIDISFPTKNAWEVLENLNEINFTK